MIDKDVLRLPNLLASNYSAAYPFPYVSIDNFMDTYILDKVVEELKVYDNWSTDSTEYVAGYQQNKWYTPHALELDDIHTFRAKAPVTNMVLDYMYSPEAITFLEDLTGIRGLIGDPELLGGGVHKIDRGGKLGIHADFNVHFRSGLWRRINVLIYLNKDWSEQWGGNLELWDKQLEQCRVKVTPVYNRATIFNITDDHYHGHPHPLNTPPGVSRYSLALYYYTYDRPEHEKSPLHPVLWKDTP